MCDNMSSRGSNENQEQELSSDCVDVPAPESYSGPFTGNTIVFTNPPYIDAYSYYAKARRSFRKTINAQRNWALGQRESLTIGGLSVSYSRDLIKWKRRIKWLPMSFLRASKKRHSSQSL